MTIYSEIALERKRQDKIWRVQNHKPIEWVSILVEEVGEVSREALEDHFKSQFPANIDTTDHLAKYRKELIQTAAVCVAMIENLDKRQRPL